MSVSRNGTHERFLRREITPNNAAAAGASLAGGVGSASRGALGGRWAERRAVRRRLGSKMREIARPSMTCARVMGGVAGSTLAVIFLFFPRHAASLFARLSPQVTFFVPTTLPAVALTIDDGPDSQGTPDILDALREHQARATFFVIGEHVAGNETPVVSHPG
jgi:polysaccharide deacetylase